MMQKYLLAALNIRSNEAQHVYTLVKIKFILGLATSFLVVGSMTLFLSTNSSHQLPSIYLLVALMLFPINFIYNYLDHHYTPDRVLLIITAFCGLSTAALLSTQYLLKESDLAFFITAWNVVLYMLVGYAFWGLSSTVFNVRESRRVFSIIGAGDIPSKLLGYVASSFIIPMIGAINFLGLSVVLFGICYFYFLYIKKEIPRNEIHETHTVLEEKHKNFLLDIFGNKLIFYISLLSFIAYLVYLFIDYTFLSEIKERFTSEQELATFISLFFAGGRVLAFFFKMIFSSRVISKLGLSKSLMLTPAITFLICLYILALYAMGADTHIFLYVFGLMFVISEILRSVIQEPVFFILFQPLSIHTRLKGHLVAKGYIFPIALLLSGIFLKLILTDDSPLSIPFIVAVIIIQLVLWMMVIPLIKREYFKAVSRSIQSGFFTGQSLFLEDGNARSILLDKIITGKPLEIVHALDLLERSGFSDYEAVLGKTLKHNTDPQLIVFILDNIRKNKFIRLLPLLKEILPTFSVGVPSEKTEKLKQRTLKTIFSLNPAEVNNYKSLLSEPTDSCTAEILISMIRRQGKEREDALIFMQDKIHSNLSEERMLIANILEKEMVEPQGLPLLEKLLADTDENIVLKAVKVACGQKQLSLIDTVVKAYFLQRDSYGEKPQYKNVFIQAISSYGDDFFSKGTPTEKDNAPKLIAAHPELINFFIDVATKVEGNHASQFLLEAFDNKNADNGKLIPIFYEKKYVPTPDRIALFDALLDKSMGEILKKYDLLMEWTQAKGDVKIQSAIFEEVRYQFRECIELCGILYGHQYTRRILQIFDKEHGTSRWHIPKQSGDKRDDHRQSNALELMELLMPKKHFLRLEKIWEGILNFTKNMAHPDGTSRNSRETIGKTQTKTISPTQQVILTDILTHGRAYNSWTKAIVLYVISKSPNFSFSPAILEHNSPSVLHPIEVETREYLLKMIENR